MNVTREIVKDLLPLYVAGEASAESSEAVEEWLRTDPELAHLAKALAEEGESAAAGYVAPAGGQAALAKTKALLRQRTWLLALAIWFTALPFSFLYDKSGLRFFLLRDAPLAAYASLGIAVGLWISFAVVARRLRVTGL